MELGNIIAIVLVVAFIGFLAYKIKKSKDKQVDSSGAGTKPVDNGLKNPSKK